MRKPISVQFNNIVFKMLRPFAALMLILKWDGKPNCILCYHSISNDRWEFSVNPEVFSQQIKKLKEIKKIVDLDQIVRLDKDGREGKAVVTFDDGYEDVYTNALPILENLGLTACVFIVGKGELAYGRNLKKGKKLLSVGQIRMLKEKGWEIGFHSQTHNDFEKLNTEELRNEIIIGKEKIEKALGFKIKYFSYPFGTYSKKIIETVKEAGFEAAFAVDGGAVNYQDGPYKINRVIITRFLGISNFEILLTNLGLFYNELVTRFLGIKDNFFQRELELNKNVG